MEIIYSAEKEFPIFTTYENLKNFVSVSLHNEIQKVLVDVNLTANDVHIMINNCISDSPGKYLLGLTIYKKS